MTDARFKEVCAIREANARFDTEHGSQWAVNGRYVQVGQGLNPGRTVKRTAGASLDALIAGVVQQGRMERQERL